MNRNDLREVIAQCIYDDMPYDGEGEKPAWVPRGNSFKQDEARRNAGHILSALDAAGMVVRPKEPTEAMIEAGHQQIDWCRTDQKTDTPYDRSQVFMTGGVRAGTYCGEDIVDAYRAMIAVEEE